MSCRSAAFVLIALALASPVGAHHDFNLTFNWKSPVTLTGTVSRIVWAAPHVLAEVNVRDARGDVSVWQLEFGSPEALASYGWTANALVPGERVTFDGWLARDGSKLVSAKSVTLAGGRQLFGASSFYDGAGVADEPELSEEDLGDLCAPPEFDRRTP